MLNSRSIASVLQKVEEGGAGAAGGTWVSSVYRQAGRQAGNVNALMLRSYARVSE